jgi:hypothetical protein
MAPKGMPIKRPAGVCRRRPPVSRSRAWTSGKSTPRPELRRRAKLAEKRAKLAEGELRVEREQVAKLKEELKATEAWAVNS